MFTSVEQRRFAEYGMNTSNRLAYTIIKQRDRQHGLHSTFAYVAEYMGVTVDRAKKCCNELRNAGLISIQYPWHAPAELRITEVTRNEQG